MNAAAVSLRRYTTAATTMTTRRGRAVRLTSLRRRDPSTMSTRRGRDLPKMSRRHRRGAVMMSILAASTLG